ncbi:flavin reductase family protein [Jannaschia seohaensis]|uniref:Flavin reductase (DIM6/NTAB) family NADH-FMN oxidoreductase RutF n=1 Tax=Jannaschia seohaensis TaxID=475081 RepID=A0A2Y9C5H5_9RHOB|nr:flavin reductase family protein [Jannaschia seohaensis]PWJ20913.1 flavin reductase (DIM6/NTAB) family NADH-FMN oxidoreductase RutF [Jannaschia seohaensis]SSA41323.1 NADH-FMN oxidoreductase RutF, flavin reductase (DIM6/NTAB) family [Jannaschia seohaensis]
MTVHVDFGDLDPAIRYKLLTALVIPRPVAWITTRGAQGQVNAAPYSFFNVFGQDPPLVVLGLEHRTDGSPKDTTANIARDGEFVVNIATPDLVEEMVATASAYPTERSEPEALGLPLAASSRVAPPRLARAPVALECRRLVALKFSAERDLLVGEVLGIAARDGLIDPETWRVEWAGAYPVARLFGDKYARLEEIAPARIPPVPNQ